MAFGLGKLGDLFVTLRMDSTQYREHLAAAERATRNAADNMDASIKKQAGAFTSMFSRVAAVVGVFGMLFEVGQRLRRLFDDAAPAAEKFIQSIDAGSIASRLQAVNKEIGELQNKLAFDDIFNDIINIRLGETTAQVRQRAKILTDYQASLELQATAERDRATKESSKKNADDRAKAAKTATDDATQAEINNLEGVEKLRAQYEFDRQQLTQKLIRSKSKEEEDAIFRQLSALATKSFTDEEKERLDIAKEQAQLDRERLATIQAQNRELIRQMEIFADLQQRQVGGFGFGGMEATLKAIRGDLQSIRGVIR
jgi:hypothetical protein